MTVEITILDNGLTIATDAMPHLESAALGVWVKAGSRDEGDSEHGIAHLLEHMAFKGTKTRSAQAIAEEIENVGGELNAATSVETTAYYARVLKDDVPLAMGLLFDILANSTFDEEELRREKHVILQEIGAACDAPEDLVFDHFQESAYGTQPIGRPILGTPQSVEAFTPDAIRSYLNCHYGAGNMVFAAAGAVDHAAIVAQAKASFAGLEKGTAAPVKAAKYLSGESVIDDDYHEIQMVLGYEGRAYHVRDFYASQLLAMVLGGGMSSRLFQVIRERYGLCYHISAFHWGFSDSGLFGIHAATGAQDFCALFDLLQTELERASDDIDQSELDRARAQVRSGLLMSMESPASRAGQLARQILLFGRPIPNGELMERLDALSVERVRDLAGRLFTGSRPTLSAVGPIGNVKDFDAVRSKLGLDRRQAAE